MDTWEGMHFASQRPAQSLAEALGDLPSAIGSFRPSALVEVGRADLEAACNWKLFVENHIDVLHLWYLHDESLSAFDHTCFEHETLGRNWTSYEPLRPGAEPMASDGSAIRHLTDRDRRGLGAHLLFPDTPMACSASFFITYRAVGVAPEQTRVELRVLAEPDGDGDALVEAACSFIEEDLDACERIQLCARSRHFGIGPLALDHERPITTFHDHLLGLLGHRPTETAAP
jgi:phenylpropionate dioxygenase-like ring-hydroxylating dioxygenase large terminal subunit